jgi:hypothetical protein
MFLDKWLDRIIARIERWNTKRYLRRNRVNPNDPCLACGQHGGDLKYAPEIQMLTIGCRNCGAIRPTSPLIPAEKWDFIGRDIKQDAQYRTNVQRYLDAGLLKPALPAKKDADTNQ